MRGVEKARVVPGDAAARAADMGIGAGVGGFGDEAKWRRHLCRVSGVLGFGKRRVKATVYADSAKQRVLSIGEEAAL